MLYITGTTLSVPSLMGAIMAVGVASANSILLVTFAREQQLAGSTAFDAAISAGHTRIRPVLMTATAMIVGMIPMAIGDPGEEQNAALARAVIGGLLFATPTTLLVVPYLFAVLRKGNDGKPAHGRIRGGARMNDLRATTSAERAAAPAGVAGARSRHAATAAERPPGRGGIGLWGLGLGVLVLFVGALAIGVWRHYQQYRQVMDTAQQQADFVPTVRVEDVGQHLGRVDVTLPATTLGFEAANIYARASGYVLKRYVDIGDHVKAGQLLAEITAPEIEDQLAQYQNSLQQAQATIRQNQAQRASTDVTSRRISALAVDGWATLENRDTDWYNFQAQKHATTAAQYNAAAMEQQLKYYSQQKIYQQVVAPFDGVITQRNIDVGSLITADAAGGTSMFSLHQSDVIRVWVYVPQDDAFGVKPGVEAVVRVPAMPNLTFHGKVTRIADALQPGTRTLLTEVDVPNPDGALQPGVYCTVELKIPRTSPALIVPASAIIFNQNGMQVAVVDNGEVHLHKITITTDYGTEVDVDSGRPGGGSGDPAASGRCLQWREGPPDHRAAGADMTTWRTSPLVVRVVDG